MTILFTDPRFLEHDTGAHPESARRLAAIQRALQAGGLDRLCQRGDIPALDDVSIERIHAPEMIELIRNASGQGGGRIEVDTVVSQRSLEVARLAAGAAVAAVDAVIGGLADNALCLVRPPGHHATPQRSMGFCLFNNIALAAVQARRAHGLGRVLIVDWDVHHGNGTQDCFYSDSDVFFYSIHRYPFYPGTGAADETGTGRGMGATLNVPMRFGVSRADFVDAFTLGLERAARAIRPEIVLLSAGFDAHALDPIGSLGLEVEDFATLTKRVLEIAQVHARGRLVSCLEGGYNIDVLAKCVSAHLQTLMTASIKSIPEQGTPDVR